MRQYLIRSGCSFLMSDGKRLTGGELIELEDDVAASHADKLEPVPEAQADAPDGDALADGPTPE